MLGNCPCFCCCLLTFFQKQLFRKIISGIPSKMLNSLDPVHERRSVKMISDLGTTVCKGFLQLLSADFIKIKFFKKKFRNTIRVLTRSLDPDQTYILLVVIWVQTVGKGYQQFSCFCCHLQIFFSKLTFQEILSETLSESKTVWIQIRTNRKSVLTWVQTVCKVYKQTTKDAASKDS